MPRPRKAVYLRVCAVAGAFVIDRVGAECYDAGAGGQSLVLAA